MARGWALALLVLLTFAASLLVHAPARLLSGVLAPVWMASAWGGNVLAGESRGSFSGEPLLLGWQWHPQALARLALVMDIQSRIGLIADAHVRVSPFSRQLDADRLELTSALASRLLPGSQLPAWAGRNLSLQQSRAGWQSASGVLRSSGGPVKLNLQGQVHELNLPPALLRLSVRDDGLVIDLRQQEGDAALATVSLLASQRIQWQVRDRLLRLKPGYVSKNDPDLVVLTVSEPL